jgi:hypothetical protein
MSNSNENPTSCDVNEKSSCCSTETTKKEEVNYKEHWNKAYSNGPKEKLGWFETDLKPSLRLIKETNLDNSARIVNIGAGSTTLVDALVNLEFNNLVATDISDIALDELKNRMGEAAKVEYIQDDLTQPVELNDMEDVDLWIDRAVLHFFTEDKDQKTYFDLVKSKVKKNGFVLLAEFNLEGAKKCSGLNVHRYNEEMLAEKLGDDFELVDHFNYSYTMPSGDLRPYVYTLFKRNK